MRSTTKAHGTIWVGANRNTGAGPVEPIEQSATNGTDGVRVTAQRWGARGVMRSARATSQKPLQIDGATHSGKGRLRAPHAPEILQSLHQGGQQRN